ncbi:uncharacterized protein LOC143241748 [Tachypleus tridentatus]|uniref:uncharacterized protein LOC143241748 n=1 Tax=Tachypleus tridentatus TaxID=6853 RepID=UPI003FD51AE5
MKGSFTTAGETLVFARKSLVLEIKRVIGVSRHVLTFSSLEANHQNNRTSEWLNNKLSITFNTQHLRPLKNMKDNVTVAAVFYRNMTYFLPTRVQTLRKIEDQATHEPFSQVVGVAMMMGRNFKKPEAGSVKLQLSLQPKKEVLGSAHNITCGRIDYSQKKLEYDLDHCDKIIFGKQVVCVCDRVGTFILVLSSFLETTKGDTLKGFDKVTGTGCIGCISLLSFTLSQLVMCWKQTNGVITVLKVQFTSTMIGFYSIFLRALFGSLSQETISENDF